jgi:hypothetical protein
LHTHKSKCAAAEQQDSQTERRRQLVQALMGTAAAAAAVYVQALRPVLVLVVFPTEAFSLTGSTRLLNRQVPVFALDVEHGAALAERLASDPTRSVRLMSMGASEMQPMRQEWRGQPTDFSSLGPGIDLGLKPDISAPGAQIYSAAPGDRYHNLRGTSMVGGRAVQRRAAQRCAACVCSCATIVLGLGLTH